METLQTLLFVLQVLVAVGLIAIILVQHGKGADAGAAFGSGSSGTVFGSQGSSNFLTKLTAVLAFVFLANSLTLAYLASEAMREAPTSLMDQPTAVIEETITESDIPAMTETQEAEQDSDLPDLPIE